MISNNESDFYPIDSTLASKSAPNCFFHTNSPHDDCAKNESYGMATTTIYMARPEDILEPSAINPEFQLKKQLKSTGFIWLSGSCSQSFKEAFKKIKEVEEKLTTSIDELNKQLSDIKKSISQCDRNIKNALNSDNISRNYADDINGILKEISLRKSKEKSTIEELDYGVFDNGIEVDPYKISNRLNEYFVKSIEEIISSIGIDLNSQFVGTEKLRNYLIEFNDFKPITYEKLGTIVFSLKSKKSIDDISIDLVKEAFEFIKLPLLTIINISLKSGIFPESWKCSVVVPIQKVKRSQKCNDVRPVNMLPLFEKILEKCVYEQLEDFFLTNNL
ncbi:rna-directed dna polymerase from mobile element jockey-like protein, partial [Dinothrombium tinctorium]